MRAPLAALLRRSLPQLAGPDAALVEGFARSGDESAFAALVERHGPMVLGVCRRVLRDSHLADDAFQAAFLVLARKAPRLRLDGSLAAWLFGVARRVALAARRREQRHSRLRLHAREIAAAPRPESQWDDLLELLDAELARLPEKYRAPLLACYLHGRTQDEAARDLGWSLSTLRRRLERGRELLRVRLTARGATLSTGLFAAALAPSSQAALPGELGRATLTTALAAHADLPLAGPAAELAQEVTSMSIASKYGLIAAGLALFAGATIAVGLAGAPTDPPRAQPAPAKPPAAEVRRDRFNDPLPPHAVARMGTAAFRHSGPCRELHYALDGKVLISAGFGFAHVWDAETGRELEKRGGLHFIDDETIMTAGIIGSGKELFLFGSRPSGQRTSAPFGSVWDLEARREARPFRPKYHDNRPQYPPSLFAPDGSAMANVTHDGSVLLWDRDGNPTHVLSDAVSKVLLTGRKSGSKEYAGDGLAAFTPDGKSLVTTDDEQTIRVWDVTTGRLVRSFGGKAPRPEAIAVSPDGKLVAAVARRALDKTAPDKTATPERVRVWELATGKPVREIPWADEDLPSRELLLAFAADGGSIIVVNDSGTRGAEARRWRISDGTLLRRWPITGRVNQIGALAVSPLGHTLAIGTYSGTIRLFDYLSGKELTPADVHTHTIYPLAFSADGRELRTIGFDGSARTWEAASGKPLTRVALAWRSAGLSDDGALVVEEEYPTRKEGPRLRVRDTRTGAVRGEAAGGRPCRLAPDGRSIWALGADGQTLRHVGLAAGEVLASVRVGPGQHELALTADGKLVVTADRSKVYGWDAKSGAKHFEWPAFPGDPNRPSEGDRVSGISLSPDGRRVAVTGWRDPAPGSEDMVHLYLCELKTGKVVWHATGAQDLFGDPAFRPDGKVLATGGWRLRLLDAATGKELAELDHPHGPIHALAFTRDGKRLASAAGATATVWDVSHVAP